MSDDIGDPASLLTVAMILAHAHEKYLRIIREVLPDGEGARAARSLCNLVRQLVERAESLRAERNALFDSVRAYRRTHWRVSLN